MFLFAAVTVFLEYADQCVKNMELKISVEMLKVVLQNVQWFESFWKKTFLVGT